MHSPRLITAILVCALSSDTAAAGTAPASGPSSAVRPTPDAIARCVRRATDFLAATQRPDGAFRADGGGTADGHLAEIALVAQGLFAAGVTPSEGTSGLLLRRCMDTLMAAARRDPDVGQVDGSGLPGECAIAGALAEALTLEPEGASGGGRRAEIKAVLAAMVQIISRELPMRSTPSTAPNLPSATSDLAIAARSASTLLAADRAGVTADAQLLADTTDFIRRCRTQNPPGFAAYPAVPGPGRSAPATRSGPVSVSTMAQAAIALSRDESPLAPDSSAILQVILAVPPPADASDMPHWHYQRVHAALLIDPDTLPPVYEMAARYFISIQRSDGAFALPNERHPATSTAYGLLTLSAPASLTLETRR